MEFLLLINIFINHFCKSVFTSKLVFTFLNSLLFSISLFSKILVNIKNKIYIIRLFNSSNKYCGDSFNIQIIIFSNEFEILL